MNKLSRFRESVYDPAESKQEQRQILLQSFLQETNPHG